MENRAWKNKKAWQEEVRECLCENSTKDCSRYTRIWYTLWLVHFDIFCQHSSITDTESDELCDMAAVRDLSMSGRAFKSVINNIQKDFPQVECLHKEEKDCIKTHAWSIEDVFAILPTGFYYKIFQLFPHVSDEWKSQHRLHDHGGLSSSWGHNEIPISVPEQWQEVLMNKPGRTGKCKIVCKYGSWQSLTPLWFAKQSLYLF